MKGDAEMNKTYSKPDIVFESFSLATSIAAHCALKTDLQTQGTCYVQFGAYRVFTTSVSACGKKGIAIPGDEFNGFCYHVPTNGTNIFMS